MKLIKYILYAAVGIGFLTSCSKQLDLAPTDTLNEENVFLTIAHAQTGANNAYGRYGGAYLNDMFATAIVSDESKLGIDNSGQGAITFRYQFAADATTGGDVTAAISAYYLLIDQANRVLEKLPTVTAANAFEESRRGVLKAQMLALRGISHFSVLQAYSKAYDPAGLGVYIMTAPDPAAKPARSTMAQTIAAIETDLADAFAQLSDISPSNPFSDTVMNRVNINAYRARIALYKGDFAKAIEYADYVINSGVRPLGTLANFVTTWTETTFPAMPESLFRIRYQGNSSPIATVWMTTGQTVYITASDKLINSYGTGDLRKAAFTGFITAANKPFLKKMVGTRSGSTALPSLIDLKAIRTAEMFLIRAEAYARQASPNLTLGAENLNTLRRNRITGYTDQTFATAADLLTAVIEERFKELCFEGHRFFDLKRNNLPVQRSLSDASPEWQTLPAGNFRFTFPLPQAEILANPNTIQNQGY